MHSYVPLVGPQAVLEEKSSPSLEFYPQGVNQGAAFYFSHDLHCLAAANCHGDTLGVERGA